MKEIVVGLTTGCYDMFHHGHLLYLQRCRSLCDRLIVGVDSDELVRAAKGHARPIVPETQRLEIINNLKPVSSAFILRDVTRLEAIVRRFNVRLMFKNNPFWDMLCDEKVIHGLDGTDVELVIIPDLPGMPTTTATIKEIVKRHGVMNGKENSAEAIGRNHEVHQLPEETRDPGEGSVGGSGSDL
jgi:cytidyltransferase-like protein